MRWPIASLPRWPGSRPVSPTQLFNRQVLSSLDIEQRNGLLNGNIFQGEPSLDQSFSKRPAPECARYRPPVKDLYLSGFGAHPGGVMSAQGHNAAMTLLKNQDQACIYQVSIHLAFLNSFTSAFACQ